MTNQNRDRRRAACAAAVLSLLAAAWLCGGLRQPIGSRANAAAPLFENPVLTPGKAVVTDRDALGGNGAVFLVDLVTGAQTTLAASSDFRGPTGVVIDAAGNLYVVDAGALGGNGAVFKLAFDTGTGTWTISTVSSGGNFVDPADVVIEADGKLIVTDSNGSNSNNGKVIRVDPAIPIGQPGNQVLLSGPGDLLNQPNGAALGANGEIYVADYWDAGGGPARLIRIDPVTGAQTLIASADSTGNLLEDPFSVVFGKDNFLYLVDGNSYGDPSNGAVIRINPVGGAAARFSPAGGQGNMVQPVDIDVDANGDFYLIDNGDPGTTHSLWKVDGVNGAQTLISRNGSFVQPNGIALTGRLTNGQPIGPPFNPTTLAPGDIAITGYITDGAPDSLSFVNFVPLGAGTVIYFTDVGWTGTAFRSVTGTDANGGETVMRFRANDTIPAGTVIRSTDTSPLFTWTTSSAIGAGGSFSPPDLAQTGDQLAAVQSTAPRNPLNSGYTALYQVDNTGAFENATSAATGNVITGLSQAAHTAVLFNNLATYAAFNLNTLPCGGTKSEWLAALNNPANWTFGSLTTLPGGTFTVSSTPGGAPLTVNPATLPSGNAGAAYSHTLTAGGGGGPYTFSYTGNLAAGLTLSGAGVLSGTLSALGSDFTVNVTDAYGCSGSRVYALRPLCPALSVTPAVLPGGVAGVAYAQTLSGNGGLAPYTFTLSGGALPTGLALSLAGVLSGTPAAGGTFNFQVRLNDALGCVTRQAYALTIGGNGACPAITLPNLPIAYIGQPYNGSLADTTPPASYTFTVTGVLPPALSFDGTAITGTPTAPVANYDLVLSATDSNNCAASRAARLKVRALEAALALLADYDGDATGDLALWSAQTGEWNIVYSSTGQTFTRQWGGAGDRTLLGDYDADRKSDLAVWRPSEGVWYVIRSRDGAYLARQWGAGYAPYFDEPVPGDYDGDGKTDLAVWRPGEGNWYILNSATGQYRVEQWGGGYAPYHDQPAPGDYDGDGRTDLAVFRRLDGFWYIKLSSTGGYLVTQFGPATATPVPADYDGDGRTDLAVWDSAAAWTIRASATGILSKFVWGQPQDAPQPGDYDGDGQADQALWRAANRTWYIRQSTDGRTRTQTSGQRGAPVTARP